MRRFDGLSLVFGLVFGLVAVAGLNGWITPELFRMEWLLPTVLVLLGLALLGALLSHVGGRDDRDEPPDGGSTSGTP